MASRIGDLVVLPLDTVFGELDSNRRRCPPEYRTHCPLHEVEVPLVIYNCDARLSADDFGSTGTRARWAYR
jgi:hypothetical protein